MQRQIIAILSIIAVLAILWAGAGLTSAAPTNAQFSPTQPSDPDTPALRAPDVWVVDDSVRLDPVAGTLIEERHSSGAIGPAYHSLNPVWDGSAIHLLAARNEVVAFQVIVDGGPHTGVALTVSDLTGPATLTSAATVRRFKEWFIRVTAESDFCDFGGENYVASLGPGWYPDPLIPLDPPGPPAAGYDQPFSIPDAQNAIPGQTAAAFWVDVLVPAGAPAGTYTGVVNVTVDGGVTVLPLTLEVRNFTLPAENHAGLGSVNYGGLNFQVLWANHPGSLVPNHAGLQRWFQMAHAHRLELDAHWIWPLGTDGSLRPPCDPDWAMWRDIWRPYMTGSAFTPAAGYWGPSVGQPIRRFLLPQDWNWPTGDANSDDRPDNPAVWQASLRAAESALISEGWTNIEAQLWFHPTDEPRTEAQFDLISYYGDLVDTAGLVDRAHITHRADLGFFKNIGDAIPGWTADTIFGEIGDDIDVWSVLGSHYSIGVAEMNARRAAHPDEQWWFYTSCCAGEPAVGAPILEGEALGMRTWGWIVYRYQLQGGVTWEMDAGYTHLPDCWTDPMCSGYGINGDAVLFYAGWTIGLPAYQPVASIRLKNVRRGSQDYEYLWLLEAHDGNRTRAAALAAGVAPQALDDGLEPYVAEPPGRWSHSPQAFEAARRQAADWLASATVVTDVVKSVIPAGPVSYDAELTYTLRISAAPGAQLGLYDPLTGTTFVRFVAQPAGVVCHGNTITGALTVPSTAPETVRFVARVNALPTPGNPISISNRAGIYPLGSTLADCVWSNETTVTAANPYRVYLPLALRDR